MLHLKDHISYCHMKHLTVLEVSMNNISELSLLAIFAHLMLTSIVVGCVFVASKFNVLLSKENVVSQETYSYFAAIFIFSRKTTFGLIR